MYVPPSDLKEIPYRVLFSPFAFDHSDYSGSNSIARDLRLLAVLEGVSALGFITLFGLSLALFNPPIWAWSLLGSLSCLLAHKAHVELLRYRHANQWLLHHKSMAKPPQLLLPNAQ